MAGQRPGGVTLIAILAWISGLAQIISGVLILTGVVSSPGASDLAAWVAVLVGAITFLVAFLLFGGSNFGRVLVTISFVLSLASAVITLVTHPGNALSAVVAGFVALIGLILLYTKAANDFFRG